MRKCLRCNELMKEDYLLKTDNFTSIATVLLGKGTGIFSSTAKGNIKAAVCIQCGEISIYFDKVENLK